MPDAEALEVTIDVAASPERVWELVSDVCRMPAWSPQVLSTRLRSGSERVELGARFTSKNHHGDLEWVTHGEVVRFRAPEEIAFRIEENWVIWSFGLEPTNGGTRVVQRREVPDGISELSAELTDGFMGGQEAFTATMRAGMLQTLDGLKAAAES